MSRLIGTGGLLALVALAGCSEGPGTDSARPVAPGSDASPAAAADAAGDADSTASDADATAVAENDAEAVAECLPPFDASDAGGAAAVGLPDTPAGRQLAWFVETVNERGVDVGLDEIEAHFAPSFLAEVPPEQTRAVFGDLARPLAPLRLDRVEQAPSGLRLVVLLRARDGSPWRVTAEVEAADPHRFLGLLFQAAPDADLDSPASWEELEDRAAAASAHVGFLAARITEAGCETIFGVDEDVPLAIGSAFKLWVLAALATSVAAGSADWEETLAIREEWKSLPSGVLQDEPAGTELPLRLYARRMIAISDNTGTDHLMRRLGRQAVEAMLSVESHADPTPNLPLLTTRDMFLLKGVLSRRERRDYLALDADERRTFLDERLPQESLSDFRMWTSPLEIDTLEWFASARDLCGTMAHLRDVALTGEAGEPVLGILSENPGLPQPAARWPYVGYKGGSEPGVLNLTWLLRRQDGSWWFLSLSLNDPERAVPTDEALALAQGGLDLLAEE